MSTKKNKNKGKYGEGSVYQRADGYWIAKYTPDSAIKPITKSAKTEKAAKEELKKLKQLDAKGVHHSNRKVKDLMLEWMEIFRQPIIAPQTYDKEESTFECHVVPSIGDYQCHAVSSSMLQQLINQKSQQLGYRALGRLFTLLSKFFEYSLNDQKIEKNPMINVQMPRSANTVQSENEIFFLEIDEVKKVESIVESAVKKGWETGKWSAVAKHGYIILFLLNTGLRKGEMLALTHKDLLYCKKRINVRKSLARIKNRNRKVGEPKYIWSLGPTKNGKNRLAIFNEQARYYMDELKKIQEHLKYTDKKYIARSVHGNPLSNSTWEGVLEDICKLADIDKPISPHELRHTYATIALRRGADVQVISKYLGHSNIEQTFKYVHLLKEVEDEADEILENLIPSSGTSYTKNLILKDLIPDDLMVNGIPLQDLIPHDLMV